VGSCGTCCVALERALSVHQISHTRRTLTAGRPAFVDCVRAADCVRPLATAHSPPPPLGKTHARRLPVQLGGATSAPSGPPRRPLGRPSQPLGLLFFCCRARPTRRENKQQTNNNDNSRLSLRHAPLSWAQCCPIAQLCKPRGAPRGFCSPLAGCKWAASSPLAARRLGATIGGPFWRERRKRRSFRLFPHR